MFVFTPEVLCGVFWLGSFKLKGWGIFRRNKHDNPVSKIAKIRNVQILLYLLASIPRQALIDIVSKEVMYFLNALVKVLLIF